MKLNLRSIFECLPSNLTFIKLIENNKNQLYSFPKIFTKNTTTEVNSLYIGYSKDFPRSIFKEESISIICIGNIPALKSIECSFLQINDPISILDIYSAIVEIFHKYNKWENDVLQCISSSNDLKKIIEISKPLFEGNQLNCIGLNGEILAGTINASLVNMNTNNKHLPLPMLTQNIDKIKPALKKGENQYGTCYINDLEFNFVQRNIYINEQSIGLMNCTEIDHPLKEIEVLIMNHLCNLIESSSTENWIFKNNEKIKISNLLKNVLQGKHVKIPDLISNLDKIGFLSNNFFSCICLRILDKESGLILSKFFSANLYHYLPEAFVCTIENDIIILLSSVSINKENQIINDFNKLLNGCKYRMGISNSFQNIENIIHYYHQAIIAIETQPEPNTIQYFSENVIPYIINQATTTLPKEQLCHPGIVALYDYDQVSGSSYTNTLKCYFKYKQNSIKTAEALFIHRSTLLYRLDRIKEIIRDDWNTYEKQLYIMLSLQILEKH